VKKLTADVGALLNAATFTAHGSRIEPMAYSMLLGDLEMRESLLLQLEAMSQRIACVRNRILAQS
jgi:hypothetical protein